MCDLLAAGNQDCALEDLPVISFAKLLVLVDTDATWVQSIRVGDGLQVPAGGRGLIRQHIPAPEWFAQLH